MFKLIDEEQEYDTSKRHSATKQVIQFLVPNPHLPDDLATVAKGFHYFALHMLQICPTDSPELTVGLRKLLEAQDSFFRHTTSSRKEVDRG